MIQRDLGAVESVHWLNLSEETTEQCPWKDLGISTTLIPGLPHAELTQWWSWVCFWYLPKLASSCGLAVGQPKEELHNKDSQTSAHNVFGPNLACLWIMYIFAHFFKYFNFFNYLCVGECVHTAGWSQRSEVFGGGVIGDDEWLLRCECWGLSPGLLQQ